MIEKTLSGIVSILKDTISNEEISARNGLLQRCDPRIRCLCILFFLICIVLTKETIALCGLYIICLIMVSVSSIRIDYFLKRTLLFIPLFSLFIIIPAIFNIVTPGEPVFTFNIPYCQLSITRQGIDTAILFFMRVLLSVSFVTLLVLTTRHHVLLKTLRIFGVPQIFVMTMGMTYRYIHLFLEIVQNTFTAIKSRVGFVSSGRSGRRIAAANMAGLWLKSYRLQSQVYDAMLSRGFTGEPKVLESFRIRKTDICMLVFSIIVSTGTIWLNQFTN